MAGLQTAIEDEKGIRNLRTFEPTNVGSLGLIGVVGLMTSWSAERSPASQLFSTSLQRSPNALHQPTRTSVDGHRNRELQWRRTHRNELEAFAHEWVAIEGEEIIAHDRDPLRVFDAATQRGIRSPYIFFVEPPEENVIRIGL